MKRLICQPILIVLTEFGQLQSIFHGRDTVLWAQLSVVHVQGTLVDASPVMWSVAEHCTMTKVFLSPKMNPIAQD